MPQRKLRVGKRTITYYANDDEDVSGARSLGSSSNKSKSLHSTPGDTIRFSEATTYHRRSSGRLGYMKTAFVEDTAPNPALPASAPENRDEPSDLNEFAYLDPDYAEFPFAYSNKEEDVRKDVPIRIRVSPGRFSLCLLFTCSTEEPATRLDSQEGPVPGRAHQAGGTGR